MLEKIMSPQDLKKLTTDELNILAQEIREAIVYRTSRIGGHTGPNLAVVEMSIALHYVFNSPIDKIIWDVSHQSYPHKIITGRKEGFLNEDKFSYTSGYTDPLESEHDFFNIGHTSTSVSLALGMAKARDLKGEKENIIAVIGDGSLSGGQALEAIDYAGEYEKNLIIVVNDNKYSIAPNHGGLYKSLKDLRESKGVSGNNIFTAFGLEYVYLDEGHDIKKLIEIFEKVKDTKKPIIVHINTTKGKGIDFMEKDPERWHAGAPYNEKNGERDIKPTINFIEKSFFDYLDNNPQGLILNAGVPMSIGFHPDVREKYKEQFVDVGIAEETAVAMSSGAAKNGINPVVCTWATFFQRTYDQLNHDVALNNNPATIVLLGAGVNGLNSKTHVALWDIQMIGHIPNFVYLAPTTQEEYQAMFNYATTQRKNPVAIRAQFNLPATGIKDETDYSKLNRFKVVKKGSKVAIIAIGNLMERAKKLYDLVKEKDNIEITIINPVYLSGIDKEYLDRIEDEHKLVITLEDGAKYQGYGVNIASYLGNKNIDVINLGLEKEFYDNFDPEKLLDENNMSVECMYKLVKKYL